MRSKLKSPEAQPRAACARSARSSRPTASSPQRARRPRRRAARCRSPLRCGGSARGGGWRAALRGSTGSRPREERGGGRHGPPCRSFRQGGGPTTFSPCSVTSPHPARCLTVASTTLGDKRIRPGRRPKVRPPPERLPGVRRPPMLTGSCGISPSRSVSSSSAATAATRRSSPPSTPAANPRRATAPTKTATAWWTTACRR